MLKKMFLGMFILIFSLNGFSREIPRILMLIAEDFNRNEFFEPYFALKSAGYVVDVASYKTGVIPSGSLSFEAEMTLEEVNPDAYIAMFLPGGHAPEILEKYPKAVEICKHFLVSDQLVTTLCHGPRLLAHTGLLKDRILSYIFRVRDELPWYFMDGRLGQYRDQALVEDGDLITGRYPGDVTGLIERTFERLSEAGGIPFTGIKPRVLIVDGGISKRDRYGYLMGGLESQAEVASVSAGRLEHYFQNKNYQPDDFDMLVLLGGDNNEDLVTDPNLKKIVADFSRKPVGATTDLYSEIQSLRNKVKLDKDVSGNIGLIISEASKKLNKAVSQPAAEIQVVIAIEPDFDENVFYAVKGWLTYKGLNPVVVSSKKGRIRSMNGIFVLSDYNYTSLPELAKDGLIVDPGGLWPDRRDYRENELQHYDWLVKQWKSGTNLAAFGFASYHLGIRSEFKDRPIASSDQVVWSFNKKGGGHYSKEQAVLSAPRFVTVKGPVAIGTGLQLIEKVFLP